MIRISQITDPAEKQKVIASLATPRKWDIMTVQCLYYGHSFVHRYSTWVQNNPRYKDGGLRNGELNMLYHGEGGAKVERLLHQDNLQVVESLAPDAVIVEVGTNDLADEGYRPSDLLQQVLKLINELKDRRVRYICVCSVIYRGKNAKRTCEGYQGKVVAYNLQAAARINRLPNCMFWKHPGFWKNINECVVKKDKVHLNDLGQYKLYNSLRSVCMRIVRRTRPCLYRK